MDLKNSLFTHTHQTYNSEGREEASLFVRSCFFVEAVVVVTVRRVRKKGTGKGTAQTVCM